MCGINIIISTADQQIKEPLQRMQSANSYRGPDASGLFIQTNINWHIGVGVNRLQVVDKDPASNQPMISTCGNYVLAYNGEVYNYQDLKNQLIDSGHDFKTHSDTEVVLHWLQEFGARGLSDFKGMFALVFVDLAENKVLMARDRHGIKPLFYTQTSDKVIISSSINSIKASGLTRLTINKKAISDYLSYRHVMGNYTYYQEVQSQQQGAVSVYDKNLVAENSIIKTPPSEEGKDLKSTIIDTASLFFEAATPPGLMLSGGVDSTLLLAILRNELGIGGIKTYTLAAGEDRRWARKAAHQYDSQHHEIPVSIEDLDYVDEFFKQMDQPIGDHGAFATWLVAGEAAKNGNALLSGAGADELFAGYNRHRAFNYYLRNQQKVLFYQKTINKLGLRGILPMAARQFLRGVDINPIFTYQKFLQSHGVNEISDIEIFWDAPKSLSENLNEALEFDRSHYLVADVLAITDNATMQQGIEARVPYLYDDIAGLANNISVAEKIKNKGKNPLKEILSGYGGIQYTKRRKQGFGLPLASWLRSKKSFWLWEFLLKDSPIFEYVPKLKIYELLGLHQRGNEDNSMQLWSILVLEKWLSRNS